MRAVDGGRWAEAHKKTYLNCLPPTRLLAAPRLFVPIPGRARAARCPLPALTFSRLTVAFLSVVKGGRGDRESNRRRRGGKHKNLTMIARRPPPPPPRSPASRATFARPSFPGPSLSTCLSTGVDRIVRAIEGEGGENTKISPCSTAAFPPAPTPVPGDVRPFVLPSSVSSHLLVDGGGPDHGKLKAKGERTQKSHHV